MTAGKRTEFKPPKLRPDPPAIKGTSVFITKPIKLTGWPLYKSRYLKYVYRKIPCGPVDVSYYTELAAKRWKSMSDLEKAHYESLVPASARITYEIVKLEFPGDTKNATHNEKHVQKMDLAEKMTGMRM